MRFDLPESIEALLSGRKTQTRRRDPSGYWLRKQVGEAITIVHNGQRLGSALVTRAPRRQALCRMTGPEAEREGYESCLSFYDAWKRMDPDAAAADEVTVIEFGPVDWRSPA